MRHVLRSLVRPVSSSLTALCLLAAAGPWLVASVGPARAENPFLKKQGPRVIREIRFQGNHLTKEYVLRRELGFTEGDVYDDDALNDAWFRLEQLDFVAYVDIQVQRPEPGQVVLVIQVEEDHRFDGRPTLRWNRRFDWMYGLRGTMINFRGRAETLWAKAHWGHQQHYSLGWQNPWILGKAHLGVGLSGYYERYRFVYHPFRFEDIGGSFALWRELVPKLRARASYTWRSTKISDSGRPTVYPEGSTDDPYVKVGLEYDSRDLRYYPSHGIDARASATFGAAGGNDLDAYSFYDLFLSAFQEVPVLGVLAGRISYRGASDPLPVYERSYLGGPADIRGVEFSSVRGDENFLATLELRHPILMVPLRDGRAVGVGVHGFIDWGTAWEQAQSLGDAKMRHSGGVGLHVNLNTYNLRFEWAFSDHDGNSFVFADEFTF